MPNFSAEQALDCLLSSGKDIPFIILSGAVSAEEVVTLLKKGAHDFLTKGDLARLVPAIEREMRESVVRSERKRAEERVRILSLAVEQSPVSVFITDMYGVITYVNPKFEDITGYSSCEAVGKNIDFTLYEGDSKALLKSVWGSIKEGRAWSGERCSVRSDGQLFWEFANISSLENLNGKTTHFIAVKEDITVRRNYEAQLLRKAHYDDLTGLANRALMVERLDQAVSLSVIKSQQGALMCIDLDHFKNINDTVGHSVGDELLVEAVARLASSLEKGDTLARMGGDEFVVILPYITDERSVVDVADEILHKFTKPFHINRQDHFVTSSIGIAIVVV